MAAPDGHEPVPHASDLIYGDVDGRWQVTNGNLLANNTLPSDEIEMQLGRIDFAQVSGGDIELETHLLRAYFDKNHNWRHGRHGDLRNAYGDGGGLVVELSGLRNVVGPQSITTGGHHDAGEERLSLWGVDFGDNAGRLYAERYENKAVFAINFGSHKQRIELSNNAMIALLAQPWYPLAVGWGARPAWWLHHMALGGSIGDVHMRTVNNGIASEGYDTSMDYIPTGLFLWRNPIWVNLMGDPTLRAFPVMPPHDFVGEIKPEGAHLAWTASPDPDVFGYFIYRREADETFQLISGPGPIDATTYVDGNATSDAIYMLRALARKDVHAGSFQTLSQGVFTQLGQPTLTAPNVELDTQKNTSVPISLAQDARIFGFIRGPEVGDLTFEAGAWSYAPPLNFVGSVDLQYVISDAFSSAEGVLEITVRD